MLVNIDMQPEFEAANDERTNQEIISLVHQAKLIGERILVVEYASNGFWDYSGTNEEIMDAIGDYDKYDVIEKPWDDGSEEIWNYVMQLSENDSTFNYADEHYSFVGVNWGACVRDTVIGMADLTDNLSVIERACNQPDDWDSWDRTRYHLEEYAEIE